MSLKLYEISNEIFNLLEQVDLETGELPTELDSVIANFKSKGASVAAYVLNLQAEIEVRKEHIKKLQQACKARENKANRLHDFLKEHMARTGINKIEASNFSFSATLYRDRDESVEVYDEDLIDEKYMRVIPQKLEPNKNEIKKALKAGIEIQGARLAKKDRLEIK